MALSFEDSLKNNVQAEPIKPMIATASMAMAPAEVSTSSIMTLDETYGIAAYSGDGGNWQQHRDYVYYYSFSDEDVSTINEEKDILLNRKQFNITQEENSQYIPFEMPRYYDGFDLVNTSISIHYETYGKRHGATKPINVTFNDEKIRFGWLVDAGATIDAGALKFEIHAYGTVTGSDGNPKSYVWKSKSNANLVVLQSICDCEEVVNHIDDSWVQELVTNVAKKVADEIKNVAVGEQVEAAEAAATAAEQFAKDAKQYSENASTAATNAVNAVLDNYATTNYVDEAVAGVDVTEQLSSYVKTSDLETNYYTKTDTEQRLSSALENYATKEDVSTAITEADITSKLENYYTKEETYNRSEIDDKVSNVTVDLTGYATEKYVDDKTGILSGKIDSNTSGISSLGKTVADLQETVNSVDTSPRLTYDIVYNDLEDVNGGENKLVLYEIENEGKENEVKTPKKVYTIVGGGGGSASANTLYINYDVDKNGNNITSYVFTIENMSDEEAVIRHGFSGVDSAGDTVSYADATWQFRKGTSGQWTTISTGTMYPGTGIEFNISKYMSTASTYQFKLVATDESGGYASKTWTVELINIKLESTFNDKLTYPIGSVYFDYTPHGNVSKDIHFVLDGKEIGKVTTTSSGIPMSYEIPAQEHGAHLLEVYMTAEINGNILGVEEIINEENGKVVGYNHTIKIIKDIIWYDSTSTIPVIGTTYQNFTARQYDATNIEYTVYDPTTETPTVEIAVDGTVVSNPTLDTTTNIYSFKTDVVGEHIITITCGETIKHLTANITKLDIEVNPVIAGLAFDFNPSGKSNNDADRIWSNGTVSMTVSDNFDWINGGYQYDSNGDQYFCIKAGTYAEIDYQLFADDAKKNGKEFKLVFKTTNVSASDATFLTCIDNTTGSNHIGIQMNVHEAYIYGEVNSLKLPYSEDDIIEFEFNISKNTETIPMVMAYEDGVSTRPMVYDSTYNFTQNTPKVITLGSDDCDLHIYRFKVYASSLTDKGILNNFIADARNAEEMVARYNRNQIYNKNNVLDPDVLAEKCPWLRVIKIEAPYFTSDKDERIGGTTIQHIYKDGLRPSDNWIATDAAHSGQGTSSNNYGAAGRNLDLMIKRVKDKKTGIYVNENPIFTLSDGTTTNKVSLTDNSVPVNYFNVKVNIASSNNLTNPLLAKRYNEFNPYDRAFVRPIALEDRYTEDEIGAMSEEKLAEATAALKLEEQAEIAKIKDTMEFYNCVIFVKETDQTQDSNGNYINHREFNNTDYNFYALGNIGDSKKTDDTRLTDMDDPYECCIEVMDVRRELSDFPVNTIVNAMRYETDDEGNKTYLWAKNENLGILYELIDGEYVLTKDTTVDLTKTYYVDALEHDDFSEDYTYGWRYISDEDDENIVNYCHQKWIEAYRFVVRDLPTNSEGKIDIESDEVAAWKSEFENYFVLNSILYYYLFTTRYCMVDNRAKNLFFHYGKTADVDSEGNPIRKFDLAWDYDNDTSLGLNNYGAMVYRYGLEDIDVDENGVEVFRESDSTFFCRVRDLFADELESLYKTLESKNAWNANTFITECDDWQSQFPEELWRLDIERKYIRTYTSSYINGSGRQEFLKTMANGKMKYHRRQWERSQEQYMASKYKTATAGSDNNSIILRCQIPNWDSSIPCNYSLKLRAYDTIYLNVQYGTGNNPRHVRVKPNQLSEDIEINYTGETDIIKIYSAPFIRSLGDVSACYPYSVSIGNANKLKELIVGNGDDGYDSPQDVSLEFGSNPLLEKINIENISGYKGSLDLSALNNLKELYAHGTNTSGVTFADGGKIEIAELPAITSATMKNLVYLANLDITDLSKLTTLTVENCNTIDLVSILNNATNINRVRITGVDWILENGGSGEDKEVPLLNRLYAMKGLDKNGYNADQSVLTGKVHVPVIRQQKLVDYKKAWPDLEIVADTIIEQFAVTFMNADGNVLEVQYVDKGEDAIDPTKRVDSPLFPTIASTISHDFTFAGWDGSLLDVFSERTITATYTESLRSYTIKYVSKGVTLQESTGLYGENVPYTGVNPTYTAEEGGYVYYLFNRWDKSGFIDGEKTVNAIFDKFEYTASSFTGRDLTDLSPVEIYAMNKLNLAESVVTNKDSYTIVVGNNIDYDDIESELLISEKTYFNGSNHIDTGVQLFDEDKDFVLAIDYEFLSGNASNVVLAQCFQDNGTNGFKLWYGASGSFTGARLTWGTTSDNIVGINKREIIVIRHKKGENNLTIYKSNLDGNDVQSVELARTKSTTGDCPLVFGCARADDGIYENHAIGNVNWAKVWYADLGDDVCKNLAMWTHESITLEACGFRKYYLSDNTSKRCSFSLLASHLLGRAKTWNTSNTNAGGWAESSLNKSLNERLYNAMPTQIKALLKKVIVYSSIGQMSSELSSSDCYITIPALIEVDPTQTSEPYNSEGTSISYLSTNDSRKRTFDNGDYSAYWLRSPNAGYVNYIWRVDENGQTQGITNATNPLGVLIELSF